jgi:hypothetical protein
MQKEIYGAAGFGIPGKLAESDCPVRSFCLKSITSCAIIAKIFRIKQ